MGQVQIQQRDEDVLLVLEGDFSIEGAAELREDCLRAVVSGKEIVMDWTGLASIDLSFVQIIASLLRTGKEKGTSISLRGSLPDPIVSFLTQYGFIEILSFANQMEGDVHE